MNREGVTLIELLVVVAIVSILVIALGFSYAGWRGRYNVEKATKDIYTDLMDARGRSVSRGLAYFVDFNTPAPPAGKGRYRIIPDTNGNLANDDTALPTFPKTIDYEITWDGGGAITFDRGGIITYPALTAVPPVDPATVRLNSTSDPDYDCIIVARSRIDTGKWNTATGVCDVK